MNIRRHPVAAPLSLLILLFMWVPLIVVAVNSFNTQTIMAGWGGFIFAGAFAGLISAFIVKDASFLGALGVLFPDGLNLIPFGNDLAHLFGADHLGFHCARWADAFLACCSELLGANVNRSARRRLVVNERWRDASSSRISPSCSRSLSSSS